MQRIVINTAAISTATFGQKDAPAAPDGRPTEVLTDPTTTTCKWVAPDGTETELVYGTDPASVIDKESTGYFSSVHILNAIGTWRARWIGTGTVAAEQVYYFECYELD